jgi:multimeric flavodoxin WrbA
MKVLGIVGSPRIKGNTESLVSHALKAINDEGLETELIRLAGRDIRPCIACAVCNSEERCAIDDDFFPIYEKMKRADGIIVGSPVYLSSASGLIKSFLERAGHICHFHGYPLRRKVGGPIVVARRAGQNFTLAELVFWFLKMDMVIPGSSYWNVAFGLNRGDVADDEEGMKTAWNFGNNIAWLLQKLNTA